VLGRPREHVYAFLVDICGIAWLREHVGYVNGW